MPEISICHRLQTNFVLRKNLLIIQKHAYLAGCYMHTWPSWCYKIARFARAAMFFEFDIEVDLSPPCVNCTVQTKTEINTWIEIMWLMRLALGQDLSCRVIAQYIVLDYETPGFPLRSAGLSSPMWIKENILRLPGDFVFTEVLCAFFVHKMKNFGVLMLIHFIITLILGYMWQDSQLPHKERRLHGSLIVICAAFGIFILFGYM